MARAACKNDGGRAGGRQVAWLRAGAAAAGAAGAAKGAEKRRASGWAWACSRGGMGALYAGAGARVCRPGAVIFVGRDTTRLAWGAADCIRVFV